MNVDGRGSDRFSGFADLYDRNRPSPPAALGPLLCAYSNVASPDVIDLGSGTGLSTRWAAGWAGSVIGIEPNLDMRAQAEDRQESLSSSATPMIYRDGTSHDTGLPRRSADVVLAVQAMHWMEPVATLTEVARLLRPGGVFAIVDADWPPVCGVADAEQAWADVHARMRVFEARLGSGEHGEALRRPIDADDPALVDEDLADPHRNRLLPDGLRSWSKRDHLTNIRASGHFASSRELLFQEAMMREAETEGDGEMLDGVHPVAAHFTALLRSQGSYQGLIRRGLDDVDLGADQFDHRVHTAFAASVVIERLSFSWRVRLGITARS